MMQKTPHPHMVKDSSNTFSTYEVITGGRCTMHTLSEWCLVALTISVNNLPASVPLTSSEPMTLLIRTRAPPQPPRHTQKQMELLVWQWFIFRIKDQSYCPFPHLPFLLSSPLCLMPTGSQMGWLAYGFSPINPTFNPITVSINDSLHVL